MLFAAIEGFANVFLGKRPLIESLAKWSFVWFVFGLQNNLLFITVFKHYRDKELVVSLSLLLVAILLALWAWYPVSNVIFLALKGKPLWLLTGPVLWALSFFFLAVFLYQKRRQQRLKMQAPRSTGLPEPQVIKAPRFVQPASMISGDWLKMVSKVIKNGGGNVLLFFKQQYKGAPRWLRLLYYLHWPGWAPLLSWGMIYLVDKFRGHLIEELSWLTGHETAWTVLAYTFFISPNLFLWCTWKLRKISENYKSQGHKWFVNCGYVIYVMTFIWTFLEISVAVQM